MTDALNSQGQAKQDGGCGCGGKCGGAKLDRRRFMQVAGLGLLATSAGRPLIAMAGPFDAPETPGFPVPGDKKLTPEWVRGLYARGEKEVYRGADLDAIGMPCGGIGSGQMYLTGDGTLGCWQIFNNAESMWIGGTGSTYERRAHKKPCYQRFVVLTKSGKEAPVRRVLDKDGFAQVEFNGEYPIAQLRYADPAAPVKAELEAFSPFIPLDAEDSSYPATLFHYTVENVSKAHLEVSVAGLLENVVAQRSGDVFHAQRSIRFGQGNGRTSMNLAAIQSAEQESADTGDRGRDKILFADFEGNDYGDWKVEGEAFGKKPAHGTLPGQQPVEGFTGEGLVNSFNGGDIPKGKVISPVFTIDRRFINFLIGGGGYKERTCINLVVDGKVERTTTGPNQEHLHWQHWNVVKLEGKQAHIEIVDDASEGWGHINVDHIEFADRPHDGEATVLSRVPDFGTMCLAFMGEAEHGEEWTAAADPGGLPGGAPVAADKEYEIGEQRTGLLAAKPVPLKPGEKATFAFALTWHFPNQAHGQYYATRFADAQAVAEHLFDNHARLASETRLWRDTFYDSTLPYWLLDRLHSTVSTLATGTCQWWANGRFYAYEGVTCCEGTCTHVWNYSHAEARLFPDLTRRVREMQDFRDKADGGGFDSETGMVGFRSDGNYAADGQCGTILKAYREHLMSADAEFLQRNWPRIKHALEYSIKQDEDGDGLIENSQHNTYDIAFFGPNTFVGSLYLAALRAAEEMAKEVGDTRFAEKVRDIFEKGRAASEARLWNGEYFIQDVDLKEHPKFQYGMGCLADQLFGQGWAHQLGLGYLYDPEKVKQALWSVWRYCWAPDVAPFNEKFPPQRWFITPGHAGLFTCTWPKSEHLKEGVLYREEVWTGIEYQVAGHMAAEGMTDEAMVICRAVHDRYQPSLANPYNEVECGDHYARAMASWGVYLSLAGFVYDGPAGRIGFDPKINADDFRAAFTTAEGWVVFEQKRENGRQINRLKVVRGSLRLQELSLGLPVGKSVGAVQATLDGKAFPADNTVSAGRIALTVKSDTVLQTGAVLEVKLSLGDAASVA